MILVLFFQFVTCNFEILCDTVSFEFSLDFTSAAIEDGLKGNRKQSESSFCQSPLVLKISLVVRKSQRLPVVFVS